MLKRINLSKPVISASRFEDDRKAQEKIIKEKCKFPHIFKVRGDIVAPQRKSFLPTVQIIQTESVQHGGGLPRIQSQKVFVKAPSDMSKVSPQVRHHLTSLGVNSDNFSNNRRLNPSMTDSHIRKRSVFPLNFKDDPDLPLERKVKYQKQCILNDNREYTVEISFTKNKMFIICARGTKHMRVDYPQMQGKKMIDVVGDCEQLLAHLQITKHKTIVIRDLAKLLYQGSNSVIADRGTNFEHNIVVRQQQHHQPVIVKEDLDESRQSSIKKHKKRNKQQRQQRQQINPSRTSNGDLLLSEEGDQEEPAAPGTVLSTE